MPSKRHEELRGFAKRILHYMGATEILDEYPIYAKDMNGNEKKYRADIYAQVGKHEFIVEIGINKHDKIANLKMCGYIVIVIPYTENEDEYKDDKYWIKALYECEVDNFNRYNKYYQNMDKISNEKIKKFDKLINKIEENSKYVQIEIMNMKKKINELVEDLSTKICIEKYKYQ